MARNTKKYRLNNTPRSGKKSKDVSTVLNMKLYTRYLMYLAFKCHTNTKEDFTIAGQNFKLNYLFQQSSMVLFWVLLIY